MATLVSDTGPLITWSRVDQIPLLRRVLTAILIPPAVARELKPSGSPLPGSDLVGADWIKIQAPREPILQLPKPLGDGEREAIRLAHQLGATLLIDDMAGKRAAEALGIPVLTTLRVLAQCKRLQLVEQVDPILQSMVSRGFHLLPEIRKSFLRELGE